MLTINYIDWFYFVCCSRCHSLDRFLSINASFHRSRQDTSLLNDEYRQISCVQKASLQDFISSLYSRTLIMRRDEELVLVTFDSVVLHHIWQSNHLNHSKPTNYRQEIIQNHQFKESLPHLTRPLPPFLPTLSWSKQKGITRRPTGGLRGAIG